MCANYTLSREQLLLFKRRIYIPDEIRWQTRVLKDHHDTKVAGHFGRDKTYELVKRNFYWPGLEGFVRKYVGSCDVCQRNKTRRHKPYGNLHSLEIPYTPWSHITMDFIVDLPKVNGYHIIWVVVDRFSKMAHFIPLKTTQAKELADSFLQFVWKYHGLPIDIVSDRDPTFTSKFWTALMTALGIDLSMSTAYRPQTDGQTERLNQILEQYLRCFVDYDQTNWVELLPLAEFAYNNAESASTRMTPFYACTGQHPRALFQAEDVKTQAADDRAKELEAIHEKMRDNLAAAQKRAAWAYDKKRVQVPEYKVGDLVLLNARNVKTRRPTKKLDQLFRGPCKIVKAIGTHAYRIELPQHMRGRMHDVFHMSMLEPYVENQIPDRENSSTSSNRV